MNITVMETKIPKIPHNSKTCKYKSKNLYSHIGLKWLPTNDNFYGGNKPGELSKPWNRNRYLALKNFDESLLEPIRVVKIEKGYLILDGNHRLAKLRELEFTHILAYVEKY
jgi:hypothetical protein